MKANVLKLKCHRCNDVLTDGELRTHFFKPVNLQGTPTCYQCSQKIIEEVRKKYQDSLKEKKVIEYMDKVEDQQYRWGGEKYE